MVSKTLPNGHTLYVGTNAERAGVPLTTGTEYIETDTLIRFIVHNGAWILKGDNMNQIELAWVEAAQAIAPNPGMLDQGLPSSPRVFVDDFMRFTSTSGRVGELGWTFTNGSVGETDGVSGHPGIVRRTSGTSILQAAYMGLSQGNTPDTLLYDDFDTMYITVALSQTDADFSFNAGLSGNLGTSPTYGFYIERGAEDTDFYGVVAAIAKTRVLLIPQDTNFHTFRIRNIDNSAFGFQADGGVEQIITTNIPSSSILMGPGFIVTPSTTTARSIDIDFFSLKLKANSRF